MKSITEMIRPLAETKQQFTDVKAGWSQFLYYLRDRNGADIRGANKLKEVDAALDYVENDGLDARCDDLQTAWFEEFDHREDVLEAFQQFLKFRGLPLP